MLLPIHPSPQNLQSDMSDVKVTSAISENTQVRLGLLISILAVSLGALFSAIWFTASWTTRVQTRLDAILVEQKLSTSQFQLLQLQVNQLQKEFDLYKVTNQPRFQR